MSSQSSGRRRINMRQYSAEDQALDIISKEAEDRLAAKRAARTEAREIRMKEIEKQQKESEAKQDRVHELTNEHAAAKVRLSGSRSGSRRGSTESNDSDAKDTDFKAELRELEEKYKTAMMSSAQLDNEKQSLVYQVELLKDQLEERDEEYTEIQFEYKEKCRQYDFQKRDLKSIEHELSILKQQLEIKDRLIGESGFVILANDKGEPVLQKSSQINSSNGPLPSSALLVSAETRDYLRKAEGATIGTAVADINTNKSGVISQTGHQASCLVTSNSVDAVDGSAFEKLLSQMCGGDDSNSKISERPAPSNLYSKSDVILHDGIDVTTNESTLYEHELSKVEPLEGGGDGDGISLKTEFRVSGGDSSIIPDEIDAACQTQTEATLPPKEKENSANTSTCLGIEPHKDLVDNETEEVDEFFDAVSTPSPSSKTSNFDEQGAINLKLLSNASEGTSVDPEISTEENIIRFVESSTDVSTGAERGSIIVENVTETESSTDNMDESGSHGYKENSSEMEGSTDIIDQTEDHDKEGTVEEDEGDKTETREHADILEASENELREIKTISNEELANAESSVEELIPDNTPKEETLENNTGEKWELPISNEYSENLRPDETEITQNKEEEAKLISDIIHSTVYEGPDSSLSNTEVENSVLRATEETVEVDTGKQDGSEDVTEQREGTEAVEISTEILSTESAAIPNEVTEEQHMIDEADTRKSTVGDIQGSNNPDVQEASCTQEILCEKQDEKQEDDNIVKEKDEKEAEVSEDGLNAVGESVEESEGSNQEYGGGRTGDTREKAEHKEDVGSNAQVGNDSDGEKEHEEREGSPVKDTSKLEVRKASIGGSEASDGAGLDDYDLDDIDDILNTGVPSFAEADELNITQSTDTELTVTAAVESVKQGKKSNAKSPGDKAVERKEEIKTKDHVNKKAKGEKNKTSKKYSKDKAEKSKSGEKESKDKVDKSKEKEKDSKDKADKSKDKAEKSKSSKKESEKSKQSKKEATQDSKADSANDEEDKNSTAESQTSLEPDDLEGALEKQMQESERLKSPKKSSKKLSIFKKVFK